MNKLPFGLFLCVYEHVIKRRGGARMHEVEKDTNRRVYEEQTGEREDENENVAVRSDFK